MRRRYLPRTCTVVGDSEEKHHPLEAFRDRDAFVLLAAPGAGKTRAFEHEAHDVGGHYVTARNFLVLKDRPEWHGTTLYIDGLDEKRAGSSDNATPLDGIRSKLDWLGKPRFRLSCREADWFGDNDRSHLAMVAPRGEVAELRLDPLSDENILELLRLLGVDDPPAFVANARDHGIDALMGNPQALDLLAHSVAGGGPWPTTRMETFERSCRELAKELNREHVLAGRTPFGTTELLDAADRLCAVLLLTGVAGYSEFEKDGDLLCLSGFNKPNQDLLKAVSRTSLFRTHDLCIEPQHRHIAEFLGGRYLARLVAEGLPVGRVLALLTGFDGGIVSELRGLAAWWAAHDREARPDIIERDPLGVVLYGDVKRFPVADKEAVLDGLQRIAERDPMNLTRFRETDARWSDLATEDMAASFEDRLSAQDSSEACQAVQIALFESLARGSQVPGVAPLLLDAVRDPQRSSVVREMSLTAYLRQSRGEEEQQEQIDLLEAIREGSIRDPHDHLRADLLRHLYPDSLSVTQLATHFSEPKDDSAGWLTSFWLIQMPRASTAEQLEQIMDALAASGKLTKASEQGTELHYLFRNIPSRLIWELLQRNRPDANRLFDWLGFVDPHYYLDEGKQISQWFDDHPETFKAVFRITIEQESDPDGPRSVGRLLMTSIQPPGDFGMWCVEEANVATDDDVSMRFAQKAAAYLGPEPNWNDVERKLDRRPDLCAVIKRYSEKHEYALESGKRESARYEEDRRQRRRERWHDAVRQHAGALDANRGNPQFLHDLARVYFGVTSDVDGDCPRERLLGLINDDEELVDTVLRAFVSTPERSDLPTHQEIMKLAAMRRSHYISLPFVAGLEERGEPIAESALRLGLAILSSDAVPVEDPDWYRAAVDERPELVAEMLVKSARRAFRASRDDSAGLYRLSAADHAVVADHALLPVLTAFPIRSTSKRLPLLARLLGIGLVRQSSQLAGLVRKKFRSNSMDLAQRMYWLCAGLLTGRAEFVGRLRAALAEGGERRKRHVASFFQDVDPYALMGNLGAEALATLIRSVGTTYRPVRLGPGTHAVTYSIEGGELVRRCTDRLAGIPTREASVFLYELASDAALSPWSRQLRHARTTQLEARRNAMFRHPNMQEILDTLDGGKPTNAADLGAVVVETLAKLARQVRDEKTSDWRQYWKTGIEEPEHEDTCRDRLLSDLERDLKPFGIRAEPEGRYADQKRADIKVFADQAAIPIEIKKSMHRELWTAVRTQLIAKYTRDPEAEGHGIYLVLWFGQASCHPGPDGKKPHSAEQLRNALLAGLSPEESRKVSVCVFDVSKPA